jgi:choline transport protein
MASSPSKRNEVELTEIPHRSTDRQDDLALARLGKKAVLKVSASQRCIKPHELTEHLQRRFGFLSILGFSCTVLITWEGSLV